MEQTNKLSNYISCDFESKHWEDYLSEKNRKLKFNVVYFILTQMHQKKY